MVAAFFFAVAATNVVGKVGVGIQVDVAFKSFVAVTAPGTIKTAFYAAIRLQYKSVSVHENKR